MKTQDDFWHFHWIANPWHKLGFVRDTEGGQRQKAAMHPHGGAQTAEPALRVAPSNVMLLSSSKSLLILGICALQRSTETTFDIIDAASSSRKLVHYLNLKLDILTDSILLAYQPNFFMIHYIENMKCKHGDQTLNTSLHRKQRGEWLITWNIPHLTTSFT